MQERAIGRELDAVEELEYDEFLNDAVARDMAARHNRGRTVKAQQAAELRAEWEAQLVTLEGQRDMTSMDESLRGED